MTMHIYVLLEDGGKLVEKIHPVWGASKLKFTGDWYQARADCFEHALDNGHTGICIVSHAVQLYRRPHGGVPQHIPGDNEQHGLWLYLDRLLRRYGHVYVPPLAWSKNKQHEYFNSPTIPLVAAYQTRALQAIEPWNNPAIGFALCGSGYDSFTVSDYFYHNLGKNRMDDVGTASAWRKTYESAIARHLGPHKRLAQLRQEAVRTGRR